MISLEEELETLKCIDNFNESSSDDYNSYELKPDGKYDEKQKELMIIIAECYLGLDDGAGEDEHYYRNKLKKALHKWDELYPQNNMPEED